MTSSDRGLEIQHRLEELKDEFLSDFWCVHGDRCAGECSCEQYAVKHEATIRDAQAEIQRLTGELAQARRELREQDLEADRLTRELIQAQVELAQAREERDAAQAWAREQSMEEREVRTELTALQASQQGLREALEKLRTFAGHDIDCIEQVFSAGCNCGFEAIDQQVTAALAASPVGTAQDPT
jgi:DNA repair exonuclease SbcCD ATPase subunit